MAAAESGEGRFASKQTQETNNYGGPVSVGGLVFKWVNNSHRFSVGNKKQGRGYGRGSAHANVSDLGTGPLAACAGCYWVLQYPMLDL